MKQSQISARADALTAAARAIVQAEKAKQDAKTARLRKARLDKEAADLLTNARGKPRVKALKVKGKRSDEGGGKLRYLGVVSAAGQEDAMSKAVKLLPDEDPEKLCARLWEGERA